MTAYTVGVIAASGTRFDGLDFLLTIGLLAAFFFVILFVLPLLTDRIKQAEEFELVKRREMLNGIDLTPTKLIHIGFFPEDDVYELIEPNPEPTLPVYDWRNDPVIFDWKLDDPAVR